MRQPDRLSTDLFLDPFCSKIGLPGMRSYRGVIEEEDGDDQVIGELRNLKKGLSQKRQPFSFC